MESSIYYLATGIITFLLLFCGCEQHKKPIRHYNQWLCYELSELVCLFFPTWQIWWHYHIAVIIIRAVGLIVIMQLFLEILIVRFCKSGHCLFTWDDSHGELTLFLKLLIHFVVVLKCSATYFRQKIEIHVYCFDR